MFSNLEELFKNFKIVWSVNQQLLDQRSSEPDYEPDIWFRLLMPDILLGAKDSFHL